MDEYNEKLDNETMKPLLFNSGHAFVCFDSVTSLNQIIKHFKTTPAQHIKIFCVSVKDKITSCCGKRTGRGS